MQNNPFVILGVSENASKEEVKQAYEKLHEKYAKDRFLEGEAGAVAARMYTKVEIAYQDALELIDNKDKAEKTVGQDDYTGVKQAIKDGNLSLAQKLLDDKTNRSGDWHYWQAAIYYKKNWYDESKTQLKIAIELEPNNQSYKDTLAKIEKEQNANNPFNNQNQQQNQQNQQSEYNRTYSTQQQEAQNVNGCCDCCSSMICADCCCEMMGGDLISCC